jgi:hypothetical protein
MTGTNTRGDIKPAGVPSVPCTGVTEEKFSLNARYIRFSPEIAVNRKKRERERVPEYSVELHDRGGPDAHVGVGAPGHGAD